MAKEKPCRASLQGRAKLKQEVVIFRIDGIVCMQILGLNNSSRFA